MVTALGWGDNELVETAAEQMRKLPMATSRRQEP